MKPSEMIFEAARNLTKKYDIYRIYQRLFR